MFLASQPWFKLSKEIKSQLTLQEKIPKKTRIRSEISLCLPKRGGTDATERGKHAVNSIYM